jgi:hypothetical protein
VAATDRHGFGTRRSLPAQRPTPAVLGLNIGYAILGTVLPWHQCAPPRGSSIAQSEDDARSNLFSDSREAHERHEAWRWLGFADSPSGSWTAGGGSWRRHHATELSGMRPRHPSVPPQARHDVCDISVSLPVPGRPLLPGLSGVVRRRLVPDPQGDIGVAGVGPGAIRWAANTQEKIDW